MNVFIPAVYALPGQPSKARISMHALVTVGYVGSAAGLAERHSVYIASRSTTAKRRRDGRRGTAGLRAYMRGPAFLAQ